MYSCLSSQTDIIMRAGDVLGPSTGAFTYQALKKHLANELIINFKGFLSPLRTQVFFF